MSWARRIRVVYVLWVALALAVVAILYLLLRDFDFSTQIKLAQDYAALAGALVALTSLVTVTFATWMNWRATRRQATLEAWTQWSDDRAADRKLISRLLGPKELTLEQAESLITAPPKPTPGRRTLGRVVRKPKPPETSGFSPEDRRALLHAAVAVLNGLERLSVGVELGVYKRAVLVDVGGTIIKRTFERFEPYIAIRRTHSNPQLRQEKAYIALEKLARHIRYNEVDADRLASLRRQP